MFPEEHYIEAERLLGEVTADYHNADNEDTYEVRLRMANVHARLASVSPQVAALAAMRPGRRLGEAEVDRREQEATR